MQSILLYAMQSAQFITPQLIRIDHVHFKVLRRIFDLKSSFYHRVLNPSGVDCSNQYLTRLAYNSRRMVTPSQIYSQHKFILLDHLFRYRDTLEFHSIFIPSGQYRYTRSPNRIGRSRIESTMAEVSSHIFYISSDEPSSHYDIFPNYFKLPNIISVYCSYISFSLM